MSVQLFIGQHPVEQQSYGSGRCTADWCPPDVASHAYIFQSERLPEDRRLNATVSNGHLGTAVFGDRMFVNGVYSGRGNRSRRVAIPQWHRIAVSYVSPATFCKQTYSLDTVKGLFSHEMVSDAYKVVHRIYAHRTLPHLLVNEIEVHRADGDNRGEIVVGLETGSDFIPQDASFDKGTCCIPGAMLMFGSTNEAETERSYRLPVYCYCTELPTTLTLPDGTSHAKWIFLLSIAVNRQAALDSYRAGMELTAKGDVLLKEHARAWADIWRAGRIDIVGDDRLARAVYGCLYYVMSSLPVLEPSGVPFFGLSPESLAYGDGTLEDYLGHVFWDQETWMFPPVLLLHANAARILLSSRTRVIAQAAGNAAAAGERGLRFPWEQAFTGVPTSPAESCEKYQLHVNGDISLALEQYAYATNDARFFTDARGLDLVDGLAQFWQSRLVFNESSCKYEIHGVMPPDEYHWPVNNSAYTNEVAKRAITLPTRIRQQLGLADNSNWHGTYGIAEKIYVPFDSETNYTPEFDQYDYTQVKGQTNATVKQADVILLHYPLMVPLPEDVHRNNLRIYESVTSTRGPAMTWSMFAIGHLQLKNVEKAAELFERQYVHVQEPFQVWCEEPQGRGAVNFITGMGGFLQAVLFGYGGVRLLCDRLALDPQLPPAVRRMCFTGLDYRGHSLDIVVEEGTTTLIKTTDGPPELTLHHPSMGGAEYTLPTRVPVTIPRGPAAIVAD